MVLKQKFALYTIILIAFLLFRLLMLLNIPTRSSNKIHVKSENSTLDKKDLIISPKPIHCTLSTFITPSSVSIILPNKKTSIYKLAGCYFPEIVATEYDSVSALNHKYSFSNVTMIASVNHDNYIYLYANNIFLNEYIIGRGLCLFDDTTVDFKYKMLLEEAQNYAEKNETGLWSIQFIQ